MGQRYIANAALGLAMAQVTFAPAPIGVWVDCIQCSRRDRLPDAGADLTDGQAARVFRRHGWSIRPTLCPDCREA